MASSVVTKDIESRLKEQPEHIFEVFLEIHEPIGEDPPAILITYPNEFSDPILKTAANFAYPCRVPSDEQSEHFTFVILDSTGLIFRFGYCRRSNRESTCLCLISYYPWFETFYTILNDLSQMINTKPFNEVEGFLSSLYHYKLMSIEEFYRHEGQESIEIHGHSQNYRYARPDPRRLPSVLSNRNFSVMFSCLGPDIMLRLFAHLLFERRILFVSSKLFHLTACACGCLYLIYPMHWQSIFLPVLPESMSWTSQCTAPFIIGLHSSIFRKLDRKELGDVVIIHIDDRKIESPYDDLNLFPKDLLRSMKKGIEQSSQVIGDHLARVFLRTMAFIIGNYASGFMIKNNQLDFDRDLYLEQYRQSSLFPFMSAIVHTQLFEQFSRYRTHLQLQREIDVDEFDIEVRNFQQSRKLKSNNKIYKILEKTTNPLIEQVQEKTDQLQAAMTKIGLRTANESSAGARCRSLSRNRSDNLPALPSISTHLVVPQPVLSNVSTDKSASSSRSSTPDLLVEKTNRLIDLSFGELENSTVDDQNCLLPTPVVLDVIHTSIHPPLSRQTPQIDSKIKQLQNELQHKVQIFNGQRIDPRQDYADQKTEIKKLVQQFDPFDTNEYSTNSPTTILNNTSVQYRSDEFLSALDLTNRHPSIEETIPNNHVQQILQTIHSTFGTSPRAVVRSTTHQPTAETANSDLIDLS